MDKEKVKIKINRLEGLATEKADNYHKINKLEVEVSEIKIQNYEISEELKRLELELSFALKQSN